MGRKEGWEGRSVVGAVNEHTRSPVGVLVGSHLRQLIYIMSHSNVNEGRAAHKKKEPASGPALACGLSSPGINSRFLQRCCPGVDNSLSLSPVQRQPHAAATIPQPPTRPWTTDTAGII